MVDHTCKHFWDVQCGQRFEPISPCKYIILYVNCECKKTNKPIKPFCQSFKALTNNCLASTHDVGTYELCVKSLFERPCLGM